MILDIHLGCSRRSQEGDVYISRSNNKFQLNVESVKSIEN